jgi:hypothetical protein
MAFKVIVASGKDFADYELLSSKLDFLLQSKQPDIEVVTGFCLACDDLANKYAAAHNYPVKHFAGGFRHMAAMVKYANAAIIFHDGYSKGARMLMDDCQSANVHVKVVRYVAGPKAEKVRTKSGTGVVISPETPINCNVPQYRINAAPNELDAAIPAGKPRPRKGKPIIVEGQELIPDTKPKKRGPARSGQTVYKYDYKQIYLDAHKAWFEKEYPSAFRDGHYIPHKLPAVDTANGLATYVLDHLLWTGNYGNRINVMGRQIGGLTRTQSGAVFDDRKYIKSSTKKGTSDLQIVIRGINAAVEIKIAGDTQSPDQIKQEARIKKAGGVYMVWKSVDHYLDYYYSIAVQVDLFE